MKSPKRLGFEAYADLALVLFIVLGASLLLYGASFLPEPRFEPLGSAALPRGLAILLLFFASIIAVRAFGKTADDEGNQSAGNEAVPEKAFWRGWAMFAALVLYVAALDFFAVPFVIATALMLLASGLILNGFSLRSAFVFGLVGVLLALSLSFVFTNFLYVDLG
ncbi:tripartite tricarboxylate transporter TctB family protein [Nitratireductor basaltis]|uniref:Tripartite tricarboxylate transporter TctB family protein n=1 Tax=Nitratireductor basaltis TaxID=472175 RepID=A0A084UES1_9HYPH|nr:tripartite tricarboxylate transporter TctB family protein [Nitratireductor basaltis]KFB11457.1 Tripartite tricarboxylate transporter TctB family protein [Nitratireductor basaltis]